MLIEDYPTWRGRFNWVKVNIERTQDDFWYVIHVTNGGFYYKKKYKQHEVSSEEDLMYKIYFALLAYWFDEEGALSYIDNMRVEKQQKEEARETPIIRHESPYNPTPIIILWLLLWIPYIPEEILSAMYVRNIAMESEKDILEISEKVEKEKLRHYKEFGNLFEKSKAYLQSFFK